MSQKKVHFLKFLVFDPNAVSFWAVVPVANFRGDNDTELMSASHIEGEYARMHPTQLLATLEGLISVAATPTPESLRQSAKILLNTQLDTQDLLGALQASTQAATPKASTPTTPESSGSKGSRPQTGLKAPRAQHTQQYAQKAVDLTSDDESSDSTTTDEEEDELQSHQPEPKQRASPPTTTTKPGKTLVQTTLTTDLTSAKKQKLRHVSTNDDDEATTIKFSGGNISKAQLEQMVEKAFLKAEAEKGEDAEAPKPKRGRKPGPKSSAVTAVPDKGVKASSSASTEQKGTPLFMNGPDLFF